MLNVLPKICVVFYQNFKNIFSDKCRDPCEDVSCPDPQSKCKVTDHEAQCLSPEQGKGIKKISLVLMFKYATKQCVS